MSETNTETAPAEQATIGIVDLQNALKIIDAAAERGAFRGNELTAVGAVRDKFQAFLDALPKEEGAEGEGDAETPAEETKAPAKRGSRKPKA
jgi:hypothetical protein